MRGLAVRCGPPSTQRQCAESIICSNAGSTLLSRGSQTKHGRNGSVQRLDARAQSTRRSASVLASPSMRIAVGSG